MVQPCMQLNTTQPFAHSPHHWDGEENWGQRSGIENCVLRDREFNKKGGVRRRGGNIKEYTKQVMHNSQLMSASPQAVVASPANSPQLYC